MKILVLSDIHAMSKQLYDKNGYFGAAGSSFYAETRDKIENRILAIPDILNKYIGKIDTVIVLGDLAHQAKQLPMVRIWDDIHFAAKKLQVKDIVGIVGNHDIFSRAESIEEAEDLRGYLKTIEPRFPTANERVVDQYFSEGVASYELDDCLIIILNTCDLHGIGKGEEAVKKLYEKGNISDHMIGIVKRKLTETKLTHAVIAMHHHPRKLESVGDNDDDVMEKGEKLLKVIEDSDKNVLLLHGHKHLVCVSKASNNKKSPIIFSSASLAAEAYPGQAKFYSNQFHLIDYDLSNKEYPKGKIYSWDWADPGWEPSRRPHMPYEKPFGMEVDFSKIHNEIISLPRKNIYEHTELINQIPSLEGCSKNDIEEINIFLEKTPLLLAVVQHSKLCLVYSEEAENNE